MQKNIVVSDRGCLIIDEILENSNWIVSLLIVDDFGHHKEKYNDNERIKKIMTLSEIMKWNGKFDLDKKEVDNYLRKFNVGDYGSRRIRDDYHYSHFQFYQGIAFWKFFFDNNHVDFCIITNQIHGFVNDYMLEEVAFHNEIETYNITYPFVDKSAVYSAKEKELILLNSGRTNCFNIDDVANYRENYDYNYLFDVPFPKIAKLVYKLFGAKGIRYVAFLARGSHEIHYRSCSFNDYRSSFKEIKTMNKYVQKKYSKINYTDNYIVYFLHFEPEAVVTANSQYIDSQLVQVKMLSDSLPTGWKVYVKEHPDIYENINSWALEYHIPVMPTFYTKYFYDKLLSFENVKLVNYKVSAGNLIENCKAVSTIAGTVMTEAIDKCKPVLMFSDNRHIYSKSKDVFSISSLQALKNAICEINKGFIPKYDDIRNLCEKYLVDTNKSGRLQIIKTISMHVER